MGDVLTDPAPQALAAAVHNNLFALFELLSRSRLAERFDSPQFLRWHTRVQHPWFNGVLLRAAPSVDAEAVVAEMVAYFRARHVGHFTLWCAAGIEPDRWQPVLEAHGVRRDNHTPGMTKVLTSLETRAEPPGLTIAQVTDDKTLHQWVQVLLAGFGADATAETSLFELMASLGDDPSMRHYLGYLDGRPIATSTILLAAGVAGIYFVATAPEARGRGIGTAMTLRPLGEARDSGYRIGILQASGMGLPMYRRLGFQQCCTTDHFYAGADALAGPATR